MDSGVDNKTNLDYTGDDIVLTSVYPRVLFKPSNTYFEVANLCVFPDSTGQSLKSGQSHRIAPAGTEKLIICSLFPDDPGMIQALQGGFLSRRHYYSLRQSLVLRLLERSY